MSVYHTQPHYPQGNSTVPSSSAVPIMAAPGGQYLEPSAQGHNSGAPPSHARSVPTGNGYLNGGASLPDYPASLGTAHGYPPPAAGSAVPLPSTHASTAQRHNSGAAGIGSSDPLVASGHVPLPLPQQRQRQPFLVNMNLDIGPTARTQQQKQYHVNIIEKELDVCNIIAYTMSEPPATENLQIRPEKLFDRGAFGTVFKARLMKDNRLVAIKMVLQDKRYRNRELPLMKLLSHPNIVSLYYYYFSSQSYDYRDEKCLNLVMEFMPSNVSDLIPRRRGRDTGSLVHTPLNIKLVMYQIFRALSYIHMNGICHRDIKPNNLLFDSETGLMKICDFGSAKQLIRGERNVSYICARYYRAPELLFGATDYTNMIDLWSTGIVFSELLLGHPLFYENSGLDQLVCIISKLGTPTIDELDAMNKDYTKYRLPELPATPFTTLFHHVRSTPNFTEAIDLLSQLFVYIPQRRILPLAACAHPYFDELRDPAKKLPGGRDLPPLLNFTESELAGAGPELRAKLTAQSPPVVPLVKPSNTPFSHE